MGSVGQREIHTQHVSQPRAAGQPWPGRTRRQDRPPRSGWPDPRNGPNRALSGERHRHAARAGGIAVARNGATGKPGRSACERP